MQYDILPILVSVFVSPFIFILPYSLEIIHHFFSFFIVSGFIFFSWNYLVLFSGFVGTRLEMLTYTEDAWQYALTWLHTNTTTDYNLFLRISNTLHVTTSSSLLLINPNGVLWGESQVVWLGTSTGSLLFTVFGSSSWAWLSISWYWCRLWYNIQVVEMGR